MGLQLRRHYRLLVLLVLVAALLILGLGNQRIHAYTGQAGSIGPAVARILDSSKAVGAQHVVPLLYILEVTWR